MRTISTLAALALGLAWAPAACGQHDLHALHAKAHEQTAPTEPAAPGVTMNLQGDQSAWINNAHMRAFFALSVERLGKAAPKLDFADYRDKSYAIFRAFGTSMGMSPDGMVDHLKDIPGQIVEIAKDDPKVLESYDNFVVALMGPQ